MTIKHTIRIKLPVQATDFALYRVRDIIRSCMWDENIIDSIALSCYLQGCMDVVQLIEERPEFVNEVSRKSEVTNE